MLRKAPEVIDSETLTNKKKLAHEEVEGEVGESSR
jgi:hypothetical protein